MIGTKAATTWATFAGTLSISDSITEMTGYRPTFWFVVVMFSVIVKPVLHPEKDCPLPCRMIGFTTSALVAWTFTKILVSWISQKVGLEAAELTVPVAAALATVGEDAFALLIARIGGKK